MTVTLLSVAHIGNADYYRGLTPHLRDAEVVLAEGTSGELGRSSVKDEDLPPDALWVRRSYSVCARLLGLMEQVDWEASVVDKRWRVADMARDELLGAVRDGQAPFPETTKSAVEKWESLLRGSPPAEELARAREQASSTVMRSFYESGSMRESKMELHQRREEILLRLLGECVAPGKHRRVAVVYGAWHMPAVEERLVRELGFRAEAACWLDCIVFEKPAKTAEDKR